PVGRKDGLADAGERLPAPVCESCDQLGNAFRWIHWIFMPPILAPFSFSSKEVVERRGLSTSTAPKEAKQEERHTGQWVRSIEYPKANHRCNQSSECHR